MFSKKINKSPNSSLTQPLQDNEEDNCPSSSQEKKPASSSESINLG
jgi:hypothetical protein